METKQIWRTTTLTSLVFFVFYLIAQYLISKKTEPVSLLIGTVSFWIVLFILQKAMIKHTR